MAAPVGREMAAVMSVRSMFPGSHKPTCTDRRILPPETCFGFFLVDTVIDIVVKKVCTARSAQVSCRSFLRSHFHSTVHPFARNEEIRYRNLSFYVRTGFHSIAAPFAMRNFEAGDIVLVTDLIESVKYNGSIGVVQAPGRPGRVVVRLQGENTPFPLRFTNF